jgi:hypothetical protein
VDVDSEDPTNFQFNAYDSTSGRLLGKMMFNTDFEMFYDLGSILQNSFSAD